MLVGKVTPLRSYKQYSVDKGERIFIKSEVSVSELVVAAVVAFT